MRNAEGGAGSTRSGDQNDGRHSIVSDFVSLIEHVQASMALIETAIAAEASPGSQQAAADIIVLDDVTPRYQSASAALGTCNARLEAALLLLLDTNASHHGTDEWAKAALGNKLYFDPRLSAASAQCCASSPDFGVRRR
jgi:cytochrome c peroxidase